MLPNMMTKAEREKALLISELQLEEDQFVIVNGDITKEGLGIAENFKSLLTERVTHVFHLAAIYDLAVPQEIAYRVNVNGTKNVSEWVKTLTNLKRFIYFSTAFVAGKREGILYENELIEPDAFKNHYEETKFKAEQIVEQLKANYPVTIIRPGIVKGHSQTGETIKFDGPYFFLNFLDRLRFLPFIPRLGRSEAVINLVPIDYVIQATAYFAFFEGGIGKTYHLTDPNPYKVSEIYEFFMGQLLRKKPKGTIPLGTAQLLLSIRPVRRYLGAEKEALDYFTWMGNFDCSEAQHDLKDSGITVPDFKSGIPAMVEYYEKHKRNAEYQLKII